jgi:predicted metal-dependent hydrolase
VRPQRGLWDQELQRQRAVIDAQMRALEARKKQAERKADTRRKVIAGALALEHFTANRDSEFARILFQQDTPAVFYIDLQLSHNFLV